MGSRNDNRSKSNGQIRYWWRFPIGETSKFDEAIREITGADLPAKLEIGNMNKSVAFYGRLRHRIVRYGAANLRTAAA